MATAATNGAIILWDLNKIGRKAGRFVIQHGNKWVYVCGLRFLLTERVITEHSRAVNRICFQPDNGNILLSASQDGMMKCWVNSLFMHIQP